MKRTLLIAAAVAAIAAPAVPAAAQGLTLTASAATVAQSWDRQDRYDRSDRYDRRGGRGYRGDRGYGAISNSQAASIAGRYLDQVTDVNFERGAFFVSGRQRDGSLVLVTLDAGGGVASVVTTRDPRGRRVNYDHGVGYGRGW